MTRRFSFRQWLGIALAFAVAFTIAYEGKSHADAVGFYVRQYSNAFLNGLNIGNPSTQATSNQIALNQGNVTNQYSMVISNIGNGTSGIQFVWQGGGTGEVGSISNGPMNLVDANRSILIQSTNNTYDSSQAAIRIGNLSATGRVVLQVNGDNGQTADLTDWTVNSAQGQIGTVLASVASDGAMHSTSTRTAGTITLSAGSGTATVISGAKCVCTDTTANVSVKCAVSTTTLTATGTGTDVIAYLCL